MPQELKLLTKMAAASAEPLRAVEDPFMFAKFERTADALLSSSIVASSLQNLVATSGTKLLM